MQNIRATDADILSTSKFVIVSVIAPNCRCNLIKRKLGGGGEFKGDKKGNPNLVGFMSLIRFGSGDKAGVSNREIVTDGEMRPVTAWGY